jgi:hypothetical protein
MRKSVSLLAFERTLQPSPNTPRQEKEIKDIKPGQGNK